MTLEDWLKNGWLAEHKTSPQEIAALQVAAAALRASGYRAAREMHHYRTIQSLALTAGIDSDLIHQLDQFRRKRNLGEYERAGLVSEQESEEMIALALHLRNMIEEWLRTNHPALLED